MNKTTIDAMKKQLRRALESGARNQIIANLRVALAVLETSKAAQPAVAEFETWWKQYGTYEDANMDYHVAADAWEAAKVEDVHAMGRELYDPGENQKAEQPARINEVIETHIEMLIDEDVLVRIGADKQPHRELGQRVMRIFEDYNRILVLESAKAEQPAVSEPGEFTKNICEILDGTPDYSFAWLRAHLREACDRLDAQQEQIERLETLYDRLHIDFVDRGREIDRLTADLKANSEMKNNARERNRLLQKEVTARDERIAELVKAIRRCLSAWKGEQNCAEKEWLEQALKGAKP